MLYIISLKAKAKIPRLYSDSRWKLCLIGYFRAWSPFENIGEFCAGRARGKWRRIGKPLTKEFLSEMAKKKLWAFNLHVTFSNTGCFTGSFSSHYSFRDNPVLNNVKFLSGSNTSLFVSHCVRNRKWLKVTSQRHSMRTFWELKKWIGWKWQGSILGKIKSNEIPFLRRKNQESIFQYFQLFKRSDCSWKLVFFSLRFVNERLQRLDEQAWKSCQEWAEVLDASWIWMMPLD